MTSLDSSLYTYEAPVSAGLFARGQTITPGGVNSPVRAFRAVGGTPRFMVEGSGPWITDADGRRYVDLVGSWGPLLLGHAHPAVVEAVTAGQHQVEHEEHRERRRYQPERPPGAPRLHVHVHRTRRAASTAQ